jgi:hypothetical protein
MPDSSGTIIDLIVSGVTARVHLWPDFAPKSFAAMPASLPLEREPVAFVTALGRTATQGRTTIRLTAAKVG